MTFSIIFIYISYILIDKSYEVDLGLSAFNLVAFFAK